MSLKGRVAVVTGGNSGIGMGIAKHDANIAIDYIAHPEATEALEQRVASMGDQVIGVEADVSKVADLERLIESTVKTFGRLDIMVNNVGVVAFLAGDGASYMTATTVVVDGGLMQQSPGL